MAGYLDASPVCSNLSGHGDAADAAAAASTAAHAAAATSTAVSDWRAERDVAAALPLATNLSGAASACW